ncbi:alanine--tRNA ligase [Thermoanaerobacterium sp. DL9XJH110]|uniref:alanine--tRNA ligase n=1 Tax=Thermoanaerobacterium sp. DL9XJH110 TaxID=3386643 RepID=UPI003BB4A10A
MMTSNEIREKFLSYFESKGHTRVSSSSLVPHNDPTLLFANAGMNQFKEVFLGLKKLPFTRATSSQKCVRAGGKHNDLDSVGRTARHHTFFEMLGNFSFGDYFKREAISYAWEFLTEVLGLPKDRLWVSIYREDDEAFELWQEVAKLPADRIVRMGEKDNFWSMGDTGPCGPCSEIYIDRGEEHRCNAPECKIGRCDCDRWRELWNLVFMQYNRDEKGNLSPLPRPSIDTGMGLERIATVMQNVYSNYDTDLLRPIIAFVENMTGKKYYGDERGFPFRVIADHSRAVTFLISDGVVPGNEGRSYVLRRILRRAARFGKELDLNEPFLYKVVPQVVSLMQDAYPELKKNAGYIQTVVRFEEERFHETLNDGLKMLYEGIGQLEKERTKVVPGEMAFMLYDTYGFPLDLTKDIAEEKGFQVDIKAFEELMARQREKAKAARKENYKIDGLFEIMAPLPQTEFVGYESLESEGLVRLIISDQKPVESCDDKSGEVILVLDRTPFYGESGGQVGDTGTIENEEFKFRVINTQKTPDGKIYHIGKIESGSVTIKKAVFSRVDGERRKNIARNHSATHLLHRALKDVLGEHVNQAGSLVDENRLRFDFSHYSALTPEEIHEIERRVNEAVLGNLPVRIQETTVQEAQKHGAIALFGEKYGEKVRLVSMGDYSKELCGGTHVKSTAEIGMFKIISESSIGAGLRRIEAVTGRNLINYLDQTLNFINSAAALLKVGPQEVTKKIEELMEKLKNQEREIETLKQHLINLQVDEIIKKKFRINEIDVISTRVKAKDIDDLRRMSDMLRQKMKSGLIVLGSAVGEKVNFVATVSDDLIQKGYHAGKIVREVARIAGGSGGGRSDFAQAGGKNPAKLEEALQSVPGIISGM